jgi:hypothetical protein
MTKRYAPVKLNLVIEGDVLKTMTTTKKTPRKPTKRKPKPQPVPTIAPFISVPKPKDNTWWWIVAILFVGFILVAFSNRFNDYLSRQNTGFSVTSTETKPIVVPTSTDLKKVREIRKFYLSADRQDGKIELRTGGNLTWRLNNPGKMEHGDFARMMGAIGSDGTYSVFPSYEHGRKAMETYLFTNASEYSKLSVDQAFLTDKAVLLSKETGIPRTAILKDLTETEKGKLMDAIQKVEGWFKGKVIVFENETDFKEKGW